MKTEEGFELRVRPRPMETVSIDIPKDALESLKQVAKTRDMSDIALLKLYIGQGLRQDLSRLFNERLLDKTAEVLSKHIQSKEEIAAIIQEIQELCIPTLNVEKISDRQSL